MDMPVQIDLENNEINALLDYAGDLEGRRVLEIGCGDGRLTWRYAAKAAHVTAIDPNPQKIARARTGLPPELRGRVEVYDLSLEDFAAGPGEGRRFDWALLSWSL